MTISSSDKEKITIIGRYKELKVSKNVLPLWISFLPKNTVKITLGADLTEEKIAKVILMMGKWFEDFKIDENKHI